MAKEKDDQERIKPDSDRSFVLGRERFAKISEVEGIHLTDDMKRRANESQAKGLTLEEYRHAIIRSHRKS